LSTEGNVTRKDNLVFSFDVEMGLGEGIWNDAAKCLKSNVKKRRDVRELRACVIETTKSLHVR